MKKSFDIKLLKFYLWVGLVFLSLATLHTAGTYPNEIGSVVLNNIWSVAYLIVINFILFEYTVPFVLRKRRAIVYNVLVGIFLLWVYMMLYSFGSYAWRQFGIWVGIYTALKEFPSVSHTLQNRMAYSMGSVSFFGITRHIYNYVKLKQSAQQLRIEKQSAELNYLKSQTNPHFLFNTLNNIYSLARDKSDLAPESILRLSKILRFMLYETAGAYIAVEQELKIISDYIELEKLRYDESLTINFNHDVEDMKQSLPPLLLMPLVENAFKHGASETRGRPFINIHLSVKKRHLLFTVENSSEASGEVVKENIGLSNLRRQLELLFTDFDVSLKQADTVFVATLKINLASHV
jgi:sensor histidine kinase YesM